MRKAQLSRHELPRAPESPIVEGTRDALPFQRREWVVQRVGWALLALLLLAALAGLFGDGPLAERTRGNDAATLEYEGFVRRHAGTDWTLRPRAAAGDVVRVAIDAEFARHFDITGIQPEPTSTRFAGRDMVYEFAGRPAEGAAVVFHVEPLRMGRAAGHIRVGDAQPLEISQLVYP